MNREPYRRGVDRAWRGLDARIAAMAGYFPLYAKALALPKPIAFGSRLTPRWRIRGVGVVALPQTSGAPAKRGGRALAMTAHRTGQLMRRVAPEAMRPVLAKRETLPNTAMRAVRQPIVGARQSAKLRFIEARLQKGVLARDWPRNAARSVASKASVVSVGAAPLVKVRVARSAQRIVNRSDSLPQAQTLFRPRSRAGLQNTIMAQSAQPDHIIGFHRTVRQARPATPPGNVYLDKHLVGHHLAAAITAEQTRAAARPNISGSSFNSSMAALRPSGAGL